MAVFLAASALLTVFIISSVIILLVIHSGRPYEAVLQHPGNEPVVIAATKDDLAQAMNAAKAFVGSYFKGALTGDVTQMQEAVYPIEHMLLSGQVSTVPSGTKCTVLECGWSACKVRIEEGAYTGYIGWVHEDCVD